MTSSGAGRRRPGPRAPRTPRRAARAAPGTASEHQRRACGRRRRSNCGWGRLVFGQTFADRRHRRRAARGGAGERDICIYPREPHVLVGLAPDELFIDPSYTYRLDLHRDTGRAGADPRRLGARHAPRPRWTRSTASTPQRHGARRRRRHVATTTGTRRGSPTGRRGRRRGSDRRHGDRRRPRAAFGDPEDGTSLWCLAVDPGRPARHRRGAGPRARRAASAAAAAPTWTCRCCTTTPRRSRLYEKLGFSRVPPSASSARTRSTTPLFAARRRGLDDLNPYARIIAEEALRRGIRVEVTDAEGGEMRLSSAAGRWSPASRCRSSPPPWR